MELSFCELKSKEIVNVKSGAKMGKPIDMIFAANGTCVLGIVAPGVRKLFRPVEDIFIPWKNITKIGSDVILVDIDMCRSLTAMRKQDGENGRDGQSRDGDYL